MFRRLFSSSSRWRPATLPAGQRVYAVGDIHGRLDLLRDLLDRIAADDAARGKADTRLVLLGDYVDRGADSAGVLRFLRDVVLPAGDVVLLMGNHEEYLLAAYDGDVQALTGWLRHGGWEALRSYGISEQVIEQRDTTTIDAMRQAIPAEDIALMRSLDLTWQCGDFLFVHAGITPGVPVDRQDERSLLWIRDRFTGDDRDHGVVVVHGHTVTEAPELRRNRIGVDTGAYDSDRLTAVGIEGSDVWFLQTGPDDSIDRADGDVCVLMNR